jgi:deoxyribodipyrimidine photo-lyase
MRVAIIWFRRDLRLHDHPALTAALEGADRVVPVFVFDRTLIQGRWPSPNRMAFMLASLDALDIELRARGSALVYRHGAPAEALTRLAAETGATDIYVSRDYSPYARHRDTAVAAALARQGVRLHARGGTLVHEPDAIATGSGSPYTVFTPFRRKWLSMPPRAVLPAPISMPPPGSVEVIPIPTLRQLDLDQPEATEVVPPGEYAARLRVEEWVEGLEIDAYRTQRDRLDLSGTSRLSQGLRWGLISAAELVAKAQGTGAGREAFISEVCWRDFYYHVLWHHPRVVREPFQTQFSDLPWDNSDGALKAWQEGRTGYPVVDAAMRQLVTTGWMHNRARMIVASFLTKDLLTDWRLGERFFMQHLIDGDLASNNGGWQWAASTGTDPQPYFRIFNPVTQGTNFDPDGAFVRRWLPAIQNVPTKHIHAPWTMPRDVQEAARCIIGRDYPAPIVDHAEARRRALKVYADARG